MTSRSVAALAVVRRAVVVAALGWGCAAADAQTSITDRFNTGLNGWSFYNDGELLRWDSSAGNPGGCIRADDGGGGTYWGFVAGPAFVGDRSCMYGGILAWDINTTLTSNAGSTMPDVTLIGAGLTLVLDLPAPAANTWVSQIVTLRETAGWKKNSFTGAVPTSAEFQSVLANLTSIRFRAEFSSSGAADAARLDNVVLASFLVTPPVTVAACPGSDASFSVTASRGTGPYSYQWRKDGAGISIIENPSAATATLLLSNVQEVDDASYDCVVTSSAGSCNIITSEAADLRVCPADFDCDGFLEFGDFDVFVASFEAGEAKADFDGDGFISFEDFDAFVLRFEAGC